jgi:hypothetical protein
MQLLVYVHRPHKCSGSTSLSPEIQEQTKLRQQKRLLLGNSIIPGHNKLVARFGLVVGDPRLRVAAHEYNRLAIQQTTESRQLKKDLTSEGRAFRQKLI